MAKSYGTMTDAVRKATSESAKKEIPEATNSNNWSVNTDKPRASTPEAPISTNDLNAPAGGDLVEQSQKQGTFVTYNPETGTAENRRALEIGQQGKGDYLETAISGVDYANNQDAYVVTNKDANTLYGFKKPVVEKPVAGSEAIEGEVVEKNPIKAYINNLFSGINSSIEDMITSKEEQDEAVAEKSPIVNAMKGELDQFKNTLDYDQILQTTSVASQKEDYYDKKEAIEGQVIPMSDINAQLTSLTNKVNINLDKESIANAVANATNTYRYNSKLIEYNVALGDLQSAQAMSKQSASDILQYQNQMLNVLQLQNKITYQDKQMQITQNQLEFDRASAGYVYVKSPEALEALAIAKGTDWIKDNTMEVGDKIYIKTEAEKDVKWSVIGVDEDGNSQYGFVDSKNQTVNQFSDVEGMRTDRHNNPIAFAVKRGGTNEFTKALDSAGIAWSEGDAFGDGMATVRVEGDAIEASRAVLSETGAIQNWYINHTGKVVLEKTGVKNNTDFKNSSTDIQDQIIKGIYQAEGGNGSLIGEGEFIDSEISGYVQLVQEGKLKPLQALQQVNKKKKPQLAEELAKIQPTQNNDDAIIKMKQAILLKTDKGLNSAVGPVPGTRIALADQFGAKDNFIASIEQLTSSLSLDALIKAKEQGATFGALSDAEMRILSASATKIGTWAKRDDEGNVKYYDTSEKSFKAELTNIAIIFSRAIKGDLVAQEALDPLGISQLDTNNTSTNPLGL